jgi:predicted XRE-type DNA-binding protein
MTMGDISFERGSDNVFVDIGFTAAEAEGLMAKSALILAIKDIVVARGLTQKAAAVACGTDQPTLSKVFHGRMESVTIDRLASWLTRLGQDVEIRVKPALGARQGRLRVAAASRMG